MKSTIGSYLSALLLIVGCASTQMYSPDGYLTKYGGKQTEAEKGAIDAECKATYPKKTESARYECFRALVPLQRRYDPVFGELMADYLSASRNVALGYEAGNITEETAIETLAEIRTEYVYQGEILREEYNRMVGAINARQKQLARERMGMALNQIGTELMRQSSNDKSVTCTETVPGTVECSEW